MLFSFGYLTHKELCVSSRFLPSVRHMTCCWCYNSKISDNNFKLVLASFAVRGPLLFFSIYSGYAMDINNNVIYNAPNLLIYSTGCRICQYRPIVLLFVVLFFFAVSSFFPRLFKCCTLMYWGLLLLCRSSYDLL
jgi:hypothetical protein